MSTTMRVPEPAALNSRFRRHGCAGERIFAAAARATGILVLVLVLGIGAFLAWRAFPPLRKNSANFLTDRVWDPAQPAFGIPDLLYTTVAASSVALVIALPVALGVALFLTEYASRRVARPLAATIDLLAAIPSIVFGLWGSHVLGPHLVAVSDVLQSFLGWVFLFKPTNVSSYNLFTASVVLAIMILPIITAITREVFDQTPRAQKEAALALGATRWEMIRITVLPWGRSGLVSAAMLGLGRALGETIAVTLILSKPNPQAPFDLSLFFGGETFASRIANNAAEFDSPQKAGVYIAAGLVLFVLTFVGNAVARLVVIRRKEFS